MQPLYFEQMRAEHLAFKFRLWSILYGETVDQDPVLSRDESSTSRWMYAYGLPVYGHLPDVQNLDKVHTTLHTVARQLVAWYQEGKVAEARQGLPAVEQLTQELNTLLTAVEKEITGKQPSSDDLLQTLLDVSLTGVIFFQPVYAPDGVHIIDLAYVRLNPAAQQMLQLPERPAETFLTLYPHAAETGIFAFYRDTFLSGKAGRYPINYQHDGLDNYFHLVAQRNGQLLVVSFTDTADQERSAVEQALRESQSREQAARIKADLRRQQLHNILMQAPALVCIFEGPQHIFSLVNPPYQQLVGERPLLGKPIAEAMPELEGQPIFGLLDNVYRTGESFYAHEMLVQLDHDNVGRLGQNYYNFIYQAIRNVAGDIDGILVFAYEVTAQVQARRQMEVVNQELETRVAERTQEALAVRREAEVQRTELQRVFEQAPVAICVFRGPDYLLEVVNPPMGIMMGRPLAQLVGKPFFEAMPELTGQGLQELLDEVRRTGIPYVAQEQAIQLARHHRGETGYFNFVCQPLRDAHGQITGITCVATDVSEQVLARQRVEQSEKRFRTLLESIPQITWTALSTGEINFYNARWYTYTGLDYEQTKTWGWQAVLHPEDLTPTLDTYGQALQTGEAFELECRLKRSSDGTYRWHLSRTLPLTDEQGTIIGWVGTATDMHEQKLIEQSLQKLTDELAAANEELAAANEEILAANEELSTSNQQLIRINVDLDNFIYTASHDLKAPIHNIEGLMKALVRQLPEASLEEERTSQTIGYIQESVERFKRTIANLTEVVKLQKENSQPTSLVDLDQLIREVQLDLASQIQEAEATLMIDTTHCPRVEFSEKNLRSIIYNLLSNAIKYRSPERRLRVRVDCQQTADYLILIVADNGLGMDLSQEDRIFSMFSRLHDHVEGSGIGLYMVKKIIENVGGKIEVESKVGVGSTFRVYFKSHN